MTSVIEKLERFGRLNTSERRLLLRALTALPMVALALRVAGLQGVQALLARGRPRLQRADHGEFCERARRMVLAAARHGPYRASCLPISLTLQWLLRREGIETDLCLGVRKVAGRLDAHAWLERRGLPLIDSLEDLEAFARFDGAVAVRKGSR